MRAQRQPRLIFGEAKNKLLLAISTTDYFGMCIVVSNMHADSKALIIISSASQATFFIPIMKKIGHKRNDYVILALNFQSQKRLREEEIRFNVPEDYIPEKVCDEIDEKTVSFTTTWYKDYEEQLSYEGVSFGKIIEYEVYLYILDALKSIVLADSVLSEEKPDRILVSTEKIPISSILWTNHLSSSINSFEVLAKKRNIPLVKIHQKGIKSLVKRKLKASRDLTKNILKKSKWFLYKLSRKLSRPTGNKIVFVNVPKSVFMPVIEHLQKDGECSVATLRLGHIWGYRVSDFKEKISKERLLLNKMKQSLEKNMGLRKRLSYNGICVYDVLEEKFSHIFNSRFIELMKYIELTNSMIHEESPDIIITMEDVTPVHRTIVSVAKKHGIPTLVIQHGMTARDMGGLHVMPTIADKQAVWGKISKEWSITRGVKPERLVITGNPRYDALAKKKMEFDTEKAILDLNIDPSKGIIMLATQPYVGFSAHNSPRMNELLLRGVLSAMKELPDKQLIIKLHPAENDSLTKAISEETGLTPIITHQYLNEIITISDLVMVFNSGVGLEAMILDKPVITINLTGQLDAVPYASSGAAIGVYRQEDIAPAMRDALYNEEVRQRLAVNRKKFVYDYAYKQDDQASKRVAQLIKNLIKESSS